MTRFTALFCGLMHPRHPGHSGGEIRDLHLLKELTRFADVEVFALYCSSAEGQEDVLASRILRVEDPRTIRRSRRRLLPSGTPTPSLREWLALRLRQAGLLPFSRYHYDVFCHLYNIRLHMTHALQEALDREPDFFLVSPQANPAGLVLSRRRDSRTRWVMLSYDVEAIRMSRLAEASGGLRGFRMRLEARRARRFERVSLARYDGVVAVSDRDREEFVRSYSLDPARVLTIDNGVDPEYFGFRKRWHGGVPEIVYVGSLTYAPNRQAARRLLDRIMPRVWQRRPDARVWIVGQEPGRDLLGRHDGIRIYVTGRVADVRPYLERASLGCFPLEAGSGTKYKVLESLAAGVPLVCSRLAAEGLDVEDGKHLIITENDAETAEAVLRLLGDPTFAEHLAEAGRRRVEKRYSWGVNLPRLPEWLSSLASLPTRAGC